MKPPLRHRLVGFLLLGINAILLLSCDPNPPTVDLGGSEVVGKLVTEDLKAISGADLRMLIITSQDYYQE